MNSKKKIILALSGAAALIAVTLIIILRTSCDPVPVNIVGRRVAISLRDVEEARRPVSFEEGEAGSLFSESIANGRTIDFFSFLQKKFRNSDYQGHLEAVRAYLVGTIHPPSKADDMFELYRKYAAYQKEIHDTIDRYADHGSPDELLAHLRDLQEERRRHFGRDAADAMFGAEVKDAEYSIRRQSIIAGGGSGREKEERLSSLAREMWGEETGATDGRMTPEERYREKLKLYEEDLADMEDDERARAISRFRREFFTGEETERMDEADRQVRALRERESEYNRRSREILDNQDLSDEEKTQLLKKLLDEIHAGADSGRR